GRSSELSLISSRRVNEQILAARAAINQAIAARDVAGIAAFLQPDYHVVTSGSVHRDGRDASAKSWTDVFANDPIATYVRMPEQIHVNDERGMAHEHGRWSGTHSGERGPVRLGGVYAAKWQRSGDGWRLEAEIFTPLSDSIP
ncbi:MAG TPA: nuclear transport factor 2 family protein, partial [Thermoanaerobaculia bacterium]|nr:nuclear transport factor 2 family protein [Thermoanaerobaculia bacterium]